MRLISASSLGRVAVCPASAVLPSVDSVGEAARRGTILHAYLENVPSMGREEALALVDEEYRAAAEVIDLEALPIDGTRWAQEVAFAFDVTTGRARELGRSRGRDYGTRRDTEVVGTADVIGLSRDGSMALVLDHKFGASPIAKASRNYQLKFLALAATRAYGATDARVALIHIPPSGLPWYDSATFDAFDLAVFAQELRRIVDRVAFAERSVHAGEPPLATTGEHCKWCPCLPYCPAQTALVRTVVGELEGQWERPVTPEDAARVYEKVKAAKAVLARLENALYTYAAANPIPLANGIVFGSVTEESNESVDGPTARAALLDLESGAESAIYLAAWLQGSDPTEALDVLARWAFADRACDFSTSKAAIQKAMRPVARSLDLTFAQVNRAALGAVRAAGAMSRSIHTSIKEHVPDKRTAIEIVADVQALTEQLREETTHVR
jgi:hypothetical protein